MIQFDIPNAHVKVPVHEDILPPYSVLNLQTQFVHTEFFNSEAFATNKYKWTAPTYSIPKHAFEGEWMILSLTAPVQMHTSAQTVVRLSTANLYNPLSTQTVFYIQEHHTHALQKI